MILFIPASAGTSEHIWPANLEKHLKILQEVAWVSVLIVSQLPLPFHFRLPPFPPCSLDLWPHVLSNLSSRGYSSSACHPIFEQAYGQSLCVLRMVSIHSEAKSNHSANPQALLVGLFFLFFPTRLDSKRALFETSRFCFPPTWAFPSVCWHPKGIAPILPHSHCLVSFYFREISSIHSKALTTESPPHMRCLRSLKCIILGLITKFIAYLS